MSESVLPTGHCYGVMEGRGGQWLVEVTDEYPEPSPIGLVSDILARIDRVQALTWRPSVRVTWGDGTSEIKPPARKCHVRVRDIDAALTTPDPAERDGGLG